MEKALFLYSTREGQTKKILDHIAQQLPLHSIEMMNLLDIEHIELEQYDRILIGASIRYGKLPKKLYQFIDEHHLALSQQKAAFICVNLTARKEAEGKDTPEGSAYIQTFLQKSSWQPSLIGVFAGALYYPRYRWFDRVMIRFIMSMTGGETDTSKEVEYTNWEKVDLFAQKFKNW